MTLQSDILLFQAQALADSSPPCFDELGVDGRDEERMLANLKKKNVDPAIAAIPMQGSVGV